jgi:CMP-N-acetylneuraminate monooxygenase
MLVDVDSNEINFGRFPKVDLYCSSFAGGASGYPLMFDNFDINQKKEIIKKKIAFLKHKKLKNLLEIKPKYFLPYASFFSEKLKRDSKILLNNKKNQIKDYNLFCKKQKIDLLNVKIKDEFTFFDNKIIKKNIKESFIKENKPEIYLKKFKKDFDDININEISDYFENSNFKDNLVLYISLVNDNFKKSYLDFLVDFSKNKICFKRLKKFKKEKLKANGQKRVLFMKIRKESFINTIRNFNPWEDLSIGFQCKIIRFPNIYNAKFWNFFTNIYIRDFKLRSYKQCNQCEKIIQSLDNEIYKKNLNYASKNI